MTRSVDAGDDKSFDSASVGCCGWLFGARSLARAASIRVARSTIHKKARDAIELLDAEDDDAMGSVRLSVAAEPESTMSTSTSTSTSSTRPTAPPTEREELEELGWAVGAELGSGHFAKVKMGRRLSDGQRAAIKIITKPTLKPGQKRLGGQGNLSMQQLEAEILTRLDHPCAKRGAVAQPPRAPGSSNHPARDADRLPRYIVKCYEAHETEERMYLFMEVMGTTPPPPNPPALPTLPHAVGRSRRAELPRLLLCPPSRARPSSALPLPALSCPHPRPRAHPRAPPPSVLRRGRRALRPDRRRGAL